MCRFLKVPSGTGMQLHVSVSQKCVFSPGFVFCCFLTVLLSRSHNCFSYIPLTPAYRKAHWGWLLCRVAKVYAQAKTAGHDAAGSKSTLDPRDCEGGVYLCIFFGLTQNFAFTRPWVWMLFLFYLTKFPHVQWCYY